jgi:ABC-type Fe3+-hydroxamate transport system substrate-binding protein
MRYLLYLVALSCVLAGCSNDQQEQPADDLIRIVAISPAATNILIDLERDHLIVGRHNYDSALDASVPAVGDQSGIDYEKLLSLTPTHVIVQTESQDVPGRLNDLATISGFSITDISTLALDDILRSAESLGSIFAPNSDLAERFAHAIRQREPAVDNASSVLVVMFSSPTVDVLGPGSAHQQIIERLGYTPTITDGKPYMQLDAEDVIAIDPGVIVFVRPRQLEAEPAGEAWTPTEEDLGVLAGLNIPAVRLGRVIMIDDPQALTSGTSLISVIDDLERRLGALSPLGSQHNDYDQDNTETGPG